MTEPRKPRQRTIDLATVRRYFSNAQAKNFDPMPSFRNQLDNPMLVLELQKDDVLFAAIIELAIAYAPEKSNLPQELADKLSSKGNFNVTADTITGWVERKSLPDPDNRELVIVALMDIFDGYLAARGANRPQTKRGPQTSGNNPRL